MRRLLEPSVLLRILAPLILLPLLSLGARPHALKVLQQQIGQARGFHAYQTLAKGLAVVATQQPWRQELLEQAGLYAFQGEDYVAAVDLLEQASSAGKLSPVGYLHLGDAYHQRGDIEAALEAWQAAKPGVGAEDVLLRAVEVHEEIGDFPSVLSDLRELAEVRPTDVSLRYRLGLHLAAFQPDSALPHLAQVADLDASLKPQAERLVEVIRSASLADNPAFTLLESGRALASMGEWALAAEAFQAATLAAPGFAEAWAYLGEAKQQIAIRPPTTDNKLQNPGSGLPSTDGTPPSAVVFPVDGIVELKKSLQLDPKSLSGNTLMALHYQRQGNYGLALEYLGKAIVQDPDNPLLQAQLGSTLAYSGDLEDAFRAYQRGVKLSPGQAELWRLLAGFCVQHEYRLKEEGLSAARRAVALNPHDPANLDMLGQVLLLLEDFSTAQRFFQAALDANPAFHAAHVHLGLVYALRGEPHQAYQVWKVVSAQAPGTPAGDQAERLLLNYFP